MFPAASVLLVLMDEPAALGVLMGVVAVLEIDVRIVMGRARNAQGRRFDQVMVLVILELGGRARRARRRTPVWAWAL